MVGIKAMFAEFSGDDVDWFQLAFVLEQQHAAKKAQTRDANRFRRALNKAVERAAARLAKQNKLARRECVRCKADARADATMCQRHLDWERDYKARKRAEKQKEAA
jgi:hypothetical protein